MCPCSLTFGNDNHLIIIIIVFISTQDKRLTYNVSFVHNCDLITATSRTRSQLKIGIKFHSTVLQVPFSLSLLFLLELSNTAFLKKKKSRKEKSNKQQTSNWSDRRGGEISLECRGMNEKGTHRVLGLARDYFSDG